MKPTYHVASESALILSFGSTIDPSVSSWVQRAYGALKEARIEGFDEIIPSYASLMVCYDVLRFDFKGASETIERILLGALDRAVQASKTITIPVYYGEEVGLDLALLAEEKGLSVEEIIALHVKETYRVYAIGFAPGFAYLGELDVRLATSRLASPRKVVPKGSVAIADRQCAVYPSQSPGGWKILGRTPMAMFDASYEGLSLLHVGDRVRYERISKEEFLRLGGVL
ncbi:5-oxoprolinase subunit PxpB [Sulfurospirillum deleyianum]|uniref:Allophanate hydrolase subunit 1 n=1 Tax=Sulfurospirillum deleyianum (strain ATCC 51133 / DSM 6946 / 5175) TaxID=525898 RepID=D1B423_SULD5|nr:5-oxoprolinase subunit PxpB [Sulfurospirillum deleyianum]ACZ12843.1 Allophanate hydrolase subunit 1 [Sulfurospirillum deleyianum DSM 6946]